ncbi:hypothetical protein EMPS_09061 [Entomortierella parvispora]|uniref:Uncharacterized protein n=1 Tax=Entomortierella parvispora TaxID=205924 RepID=A0A9P3M013_9FUNG|nr:hypothetical protein EMPS_09061 [Entomortierella parvispora]
MIKALALLSFFLAPVLASMEVYSSNFQEPSPPLIADDFSANFMQHKWNNISMSHVTAGIIYMSASNMKSRIDNTHGGIIQASLFDYKNVTKDGYLNKNYVLQDLTKGPQCEYSRLPVPAYPMFYKTLLQDAGAVFAGWTLDDMYGKVETWSFFYSGIPVSVFIDAQKRFVRYDFWFPQYRTITTTRFYNIEVSTQNKTLFDLPC